MDEPRECSASRTRDEIRFVNVICFESGAKLPAWSSGQVSSVAPTGQSGPSGASPVPSGLTVQR